MKKLNPKARIIIVIVLVLVIIGSFVKEDKPEAAAATLKVPLTTAQRDSAYKAQKAQDSIDAAANRQKRIEKLFSPWDGSNRSLVKLVKENMNDPKSFEHAETKFWDVGENTIVILMKYRGKNAFGGVVTETIKAESDLNGNIVKVYQ